MDEFKERTARRLMKMKTLGMHDEYKKTKKAIADTFQAKDYMDIVIRADKLFNDYVEARGE